MQVKHSQGVSITKRVKNKTKGIVCTVVPMVRETTSRQEAIIIRSTRFLMCLG